MKLFSECINALARTRGQLEKQKLLENYFDQASDSDKLWALALLSGRKPKRTIRSTQLKNWSIEISQIPEWLFEESYQTVGDLAETISLLLNQKDNSIIDEEHSAFYSLTGIMLQFKNLEKATEAEKKEWITWMWEKLDRDACFVFNKLITGGFRIGVSEKTIAQALSEILNTDQHKILHRLSGNWSPYSTTWEDLLLNEITSAAQPYPFYLCYPLDQSPENLGSPDQWIAEWKWDGIRGQIIKRDDSCFIWSRGDELISDAFPELMEASTSLPNGTVLDGEIICMKRPYETLQPLTFSVLQKRIGRKKPGKKILEEAPVAFIVYDLLEWETNDIRRLPLSERRKLLEHLISSLKNSSMIISPVLLFDEWEKMLSYRSEARKNLKEGLMLKKKDSVYLTGRKKGDWWKWKTDPLTIDCVLTYAQRGHGRRSGLYTDYTFAVKDGERLVTVTKAYSGLTNEEIKAVDAFIKNNAIEKFGPVRTVKPELVFEIAFEGIDKSKRHKSGVALRFPRINRWRKDKNADEINTIQDLQNLIDIQSLPQ